MYTGDVLLSSDLGRIPNGDLPAGDQLTPFEVHDKTAGRRQLIIMTPEPFIFATEEHRA